MRTLTLALFVIAAPLAVAAQDGPDISGSWLRDDGTARVNVARCGAQICATNTWIKNARNGEAVGDRIVMSLTPQDRSTLAGSAYDVKRDQSYSLQISVQNDRMQTRGCLLKDLLCKSMSWRRAN